MIHWLLSINNFTCTLTYARLQQGVIFIGMFGMFTSLRYLKVLLCYSPTPNNSALESAENGEALLGGVTLLTGTVLGLYSIAMVTIRTLLTVPEHNMIEIPIYRSQFTILAYCMGFNLWGYQCNDSCPVKTFKISSSRVNQNQNTVTSTFPYLYWNTDHVGTLIVYNLYGFGFWGTYNICPINVCFSNKNA